MKRSKSSKDWLHEHFTDTYVKQAKAEGYRSRAVYKLIAIQEKYKIIKPGMTVLDIGAAPGGWSQLATEWVGDKGKVIAVDLLPITSLARVTIIQGDITDEDIWQQIQQEIAPRGEVDVILSDMAPNISGITVSDQARTIGLIENVIEIADQILLPKGVLLTKIFQGAGFDEILKHLRKTYKKVQIIKPPASRQRSRELYLLAWKS
jgi:23S rRNA (uridine2552-2'-O)-methyltransferase